MAENVKMAGKGGLTNKRRKKKIVNIICFTLLAAASLTVIMP